MYYFLVSAVSGERKMYVEICTGSHHYDWHGPDDY
jgi:hypothetical protein